MVWITCAMGRGCWMEPVDQEFTSLAECQATLAWYQTTEGKIGTCIQWEAE